MIGRSLSHLGAKAPRPPQFSLRIRFAIGMAAMLLPLVLLVAAGRLYFLPRLTQSLEKVVEEVLEEMVPVAHLQNALLQAAMPANDYLIHGDPAERENFARLSQEVDQAFEEALAAPYALGEERAFLQAAWEEWQQARPLSEAILALPNPVGDPLAAQEMERLDAHVDRAVELLDQQHGLTHREAGELLTAATADRQRAEFFSGGVFGVALAIAIAASLALAHSVLAPVRALRQGAIRLGEGDLSHRLAVERQDELGQLAGAFNQMAEHLEKSRETLHRRDAVLEAVSFAAERFLKATAWEENIPQVLERLGRGTEVSRVYIFENQSGEDGILLTSQRYEWAAPGITPQIGSPELQSFPLRAAGFARWEEMLSNGELVCGHVREFPESEREVLAAQGIQSIAVVPIFVGQAWWGFIGFDECQAEREWSMAELEALKTAADTLGAALQRQQVEAELQTYARQQAAMVKISADLAAALDETEICQKVVRGLHEVLGYAHTYLFLVDEATGERVLPEGASIGWRDAPTNWRIPPGQGLSEYALLSGQLHYTPDVTRDPRYVPGIGTGAEVDVPILIGDPSSLRQAQGKLFDYRSGGSGRVVGVLIVESEQPGAFGQRDFAVLTAAADQTSLALQRAREHQAVKEAEARYHDLFNTAPVGIYQTTLDGGYVLANPTLARIYGYESPEELMATVTDLDRQFYVQPQRRAEFIRLMEAHDAVQEFESEVYCKDGRVIWISENARSIRDASGEIVGFEGTTLDITERKRAEEAISQLSHQNRLILDSLGEGVYGVDPSGDTTFVNSAAAQLLGYEAEELIGRFMHETVHHSKPDGAPYPQEECLMYAAFRDGRAHRVTDEVLWRKDGTSFPVEYVSTPVREGEKLVGAVIVFRDITERKRAEEELVKLRQAVEASGEAIFLTDRDGLITYVNPEFTLLYGYTADEVVGKVTPRILKSGLLKPEDYEMFWKTILSKQVVKGEIINKTKDGRFVTAEGSASPILDEQENIIGFLAIQRDISARKRAEESLHESETRFKSLFEDSPISLWEEDFSLVAAYLDELRQSGVTDFRAYFENHPEAVAHCAALVKVIDINQGTLKLYKADSKEDFLADLSVVFSEESTLTFREELIALAEGKTRFEGEAINQTLTGDKIHVALSWSVAPGADQASRRLFVSITDITARKRAEEKLDAKVTELEQHNREIKLLNEMGDLLQSCHTVEEASAAVTQFAQRLFPNQSGALYLIAASRNLVNAITTWGEFPSQDLIFTPDDCWALRRGQVHSVTDPGLGGLPCKHVSPSLDGTQDVPLPASYLCVPMMAQGETLGILHLRSGQPAASQTREEQAAVMASQQQLAVTLTEQISLALANLKLREALHSQAIRDPLTGLFNRRYMEETLERELRRAERRKASLGIIMFDLDHFKKFNDTFGHPAGDVVLREIGAFLQTCVRAEDIACRYGGEEFLVILPEASLKDTLKRAKQLREGIKQLHVRYHDQALGAVTVSLGVAVFPDHGSTTEAIMRVADDALYRAKQEGRDRVVVAPSMNA
ncbi:MAG: PAS domain S-box protein [Chloroflexi bacterium]|nr:PAS domain S-box protein [Chloroflexota bacterium]